MERQNGVFGDLRRRNERHARIAALLEERRRRHRRGGLGRGESLPSGGVQQEVRDAVRYWRGHLLRGCELAEPLDGERDHIRGDPAAPVAVVEYGELCSRFETGEDLAVLEKLLGLLDEGKVCLAFRHFPVVDGHPVAWIAAQAVEAADLQGRFWDLHDALSNLLAKPWEQRLDTAAIFKQARRLELDVDRLRRDMDEPSITARIQRDLYGGFRSGVTGVPAYYVEGIRQDVAGPEELLDRIELALDGDLAALWPPVHTPAYERTTSGMPSRSIG
jgi:hypothetical protein